MNYRNAFNLVINRFPIPNLPCKIVRTLKRRSGAEMRRSCPGYSKQRNELVAKEYGRERRKRGTTRHPFNSLNERWLRDNNTKCGSFVLPSSFLTRGTCLQTRYCSYQCYCAEYLHRFPKRCEPVEYPSTRMLPVVHLCKHQIYNAYSIAVPRPEKFSGAKRPPGILQEEMGEAIGQTFPRALCPYVRRS